MKNTLTRLLSLAVAVIMVISLVPLSGLQVYAAENQTEPDPATTGVNVQIDFETTTSCRACNAQGITWRELPKADGEDVTLASGHYYVPDGGLSNTATYNTPSDARICIHLNGSSISSTGTVLNVTNNAYVYIFGSGTVTGNTTQTVDYMGSVAKVEAGRLYLYGGTHTTAGAGNTIYVNKQADAETRLSLYAGATVSGGNVTAATALGGNIHVEAGTFYLMGGTVTGGKAVSGGNVYITANGTFAMTDGTISNGVSSGTTSDNGGGNLYLRKKATISGGSITGGEAAQYGGNVMVRSVELTISGDASISGGEANYGGNIMLYTTGKLTMEGNSSITDAIDGHNVYMANASAKLTMNGGTISGGNIYLTSATSKGAVVVNDGTFKSAIQPASRATNMKIYHGQFSENPAAYLASDAAAGTTVVQQADGLYSVHVLAQGEAQDKTCTQDGWEAHEYCTKCDYSTKVVIPAGHTIAQGEAQAKTCTQDGWEAYEYCTECDNYNTKVVIPAGHDPEKQDGKAATCTEDGWEDYYQCSVCKKYFSDEACTEEIENIDTWKTGAGKIDQTGHTWVDGEITKQPTCTETGIQKQTCACGAEQEKTLEKNPEAHTWVDGEITKQPSCTETGIQKQTCACGAEQDKTLEKNPEAHTWVDGKITKQPTCTETGIQKQTCACGAEQDKTLAIVADAHKWDEGKITKAPACGVAGEKTFTCQNDNSHTYTEPVAALEHIAGEEKKENEVPATETTDGSYDLVIRCTLCNAVLESKPVVVPATGTKVAQVGDNTYFSIAAAIAAIEKAGTITMIADYEITEALATNGKDITIDLGGKALTVSAEITVNEGDSLTITGAGALFVDETVNVLGTLDVSTLGYGVSGLIANRPGNLAIAATGTVKLMNVWASFSADWLQANSPEFFEGTAADATVVLGDKTYVLSEDWLVEDAVATIETTLNNVAYTASYATLTEAVAAAENGETIKLIENVELDQAGVVVDKTITLDLNNCNITSVGETITVIAGGDLTIVGEGIVTGNTDNNKSGSAVWAKGGEVEIYGGTYSTGYDDEGMDALDHSNDTIYTSLGGKIAIYGGTFIKTEHVWVLNENKDNKETLTVKGGTFVGFNPAEANDADEYYLADSFHAVLKGENYVVEEHTAQYKAANEANCVNAGNTEYWICEDCGKYYSDEAMTTEIEEGSWIIAALGHSEAKQDGQAATCTEAGWNDYYYCSVCEKYFSDEACTVEITDLETWKTGEGQISAQGHSGEKQDGQAATCTEAGWKDYYYCSGCEKYFSDEACTVEITDLEAWKTGEGKIPATAVAEYNNTPYASVSEALNAAAAQGGEVKLVADATEQLELDVKPGVTLDLNGKILTAQNSLVAMYGNSNVIDSTNGQGALKIAEANLYLMRGNSYLPMKDTEVADTYRLVTVQVGTKQLNTNLENADCEIAFVLRQSGTASYFVEQLTNKTMTDLNIGVRVKVTGWQNDAFKELYFYLNQEIVDFVTGSWQNREFYMTFTGMDSLENAQLVAEVVFNSSSTTSQVAISGTVRDYNP